MPEALKILFSPPMNIRTHIQALLICTMPLSAQGQSIVDSRDSLPRAVQLHGDEGKVKMCLSGTKMLYYNVLKIKNLLLMLLK